MTHLIVLLMVVMVGSSPGEEPDGAWAPAWLRAIIDACQGDALIVTLIGFATITLLFAVGVKYCSRRLTRTGGVVWVRTADRALLLAQWCIALWLAFACFGLGWLGSVRSMVGDLVLIDEALTLAPAIVAMALQWAFFWPIERRLREATHFGRLERGEPLHDIPSRWQFTTDQLRTHAGPTLVAALALFAWVEAHDRLSLRFSDRLGEHAETVFIITLALGAIAIVGVLPLLWRVIWRTRRLPPGELRDELHDLCARHRVRVADLLVWETRGALLNGALVGVLPRLRYIMLTDALLERLTTQEVEAVMAHEIAHARYRHIPWLIGTILVTVGLASAIPTLVLPRVTGLSESWASGIGTGVAIVSAILVLGWVSRRFEQQADAFAARHLLLVRTDDNASPIGPPDASGMADALGAVARHNHIPVKKFSFRHGSIRSRQDRLKHLVGTRSDRMPIDERVRWMKRAVLLCAVVLGVLLWKFPDAATLL